MTVLSLPVSIIAGITFYVGIHHLVIFFQRRQLRENLSFAILCFAIGLYDVFCAGLYNAASLPEGKVWLRWQDGSLALTAIVFLWFIRDYARLSCPIRHARRWRPSSFNKPSVWDIWSRTRLT